MWTTCAGGVHSLHATIFVLAVSMAARSEALALGKRLGLGPNVLTDVSSCAVNEAAVLY
jgi:3-hydroxyisobutyrate dehydrogenase-like beta-hydroxyacid dehydrogenase